jgi:hypothetical protein
MRVVFQRAFGPAQGFYGRDRRARVNTTAAPAPHPTTDTTDGYRTLAHHMLDDEDRDDRNHDDGAGGDSADRVQGAVPNPPALVAR